MKKPKSQKTTKQNKRKRKRKGKQKENKLKIERKDRKMVIKERLSLIIDHMHHYIWVLFMVVLKLDSIWQSLALRINKTLVRMMVWIQKLLSWL